MQAIHYFLALCDAWFGVQGPRLRGVSGVSHGATCLPTDLSGPA